MKYENVVYCKINGAPSICEVSYAKEVNSQIPGIIYKDLKNLKRYFKKNPSFYGKTNYTQYNITNIIPLTSFFTDEELSDLDLNNVIDKIQR